MLSTVNLLFYTKYVFSLLFFKTKIFFEKKLDKNLCLPSDKRIERYADDFIVPPYYNPKNHLYPYGINMPPFPFYNAYVTKQSKTQPRNKMGNCKRTSPFRHFLRISLEWDHCQFHEDCGEDNCCYVHFRFRSLPKSFCRPNRNPKADLCEPLTKYRSLKDVPAWKQQKQQINDEQQRQSVSLSNTYDG